MHPSAARVGRHQDEPNHLQPPASPTKPNECTDDTGRNHDIARRPSPAASANNRPEPRYQHDGPPLPTTRPICQNRPLAEVLLQHTDGVLASTALQWAVPGMLSVIKSASATRVPRIVSPNYARVEVDLRRKPSECLPRQPSLSTHVLVQLIVSKREPPVGWRLRMHHHCPFCSLLSRHQPQT